MSSLIFYSNKSRPANISDNVISSFYQPGYYRTENEIEKLDNIRENIIGSSVEISYLSKFTIGLISYNFNYDKTLKTTTNGFFNGMSRFVNSIYFYKYFNNMILAGEYVNDGNRKSGLIISLNGSKDKLEFSSGLRYFEKGLRLQYSNVISEYSNLNNELAVYLGIQVNKNSFRNNTYLDIFSRIKGDDFEFANLGYEFLNDTEIKLNKSLINIRFRHEMKSSISKNENNNAYLELNRSRTSIRGIKEKN